MYSDKYEPDDYWSDGVTYDAKEIAALMGIAIDDIFFTGFWSQGDGACFTGQLGYDKDCLEKVMEHAPNDLELREIAALWSNLRCPDLSGRVTHTGRYYHSNSVIFDIEEDLEVDEKAVIRTAKRFMDWIYEKLEQAYNFDKADSYVRGYVECYEQIVNTQAAAQLLSSQLAEHSLPSFATDAVLQRIAELDSQVTELEVEMEWLADTFHYFEDIKPLTIQKYAQTYMGFVFPDEE